jgi:lipoate-protein ligase B
VLPLGTDDVTLTLGCQTTSYFDLELGARLTPSPALLAAWRADVYRVVYQAVKKDVDAANDKKRGQYESDLITYHNRVDQLKATAVHDLIQGQSEAYNSDLVITELRRQCLAMITKDFDAVADDAAGDLLTDWEAMGSRQVTFTYDRAAVTETKAGAQVAFDTEGREVKYPLPDVDAARAKGRYIQFLEQAFE